MVTEQEARASALNALSRSPIDAIYHLIATARAGKINGTRYAECFYGTLAQSQSQKVRDFLIGIGIRPPYETGGMSPIEWFCLDIRPGDLPESNEKVSLLVTWCREELQRRVPSPGIWEEYEAEIAEYMFGR